MKKTGLALLFLAVLFAMFMVPVNPSRAGLGISGQERVKTLDVYLDPADTGSVSYTVHLASGLAVEGTGDSWEAMDQMLRVSEAVVRPNTTVIVDLKEDRITGILIRAGSAF